MAKKAYVRNSENTEWIEIASATTDLSAYLTNSSASITYAPIEGSLTTGGIAGKTLIKTASANYNAEWGYQPSTMPFTPGGYYRSRYSGSAAHTPTTSKLVFCPIWIPTTTTLDRIGWTTNGFTTTGNSRFGLYNDGYSTGDTPGTPSTLIVDGGVVSCTSNSTSYVVTINTTLTPGLYWMAGVRQTGSYSVFGMTGSSGNVEQKLISPTSTNLNVGYGLASVTGELPSTIVGQTLTQESTLPYVYVRSA